MRLSAGSMILNVDAGINELFFSEIIKEKSLKKFKKSLDICTLIEYNMTYAELRAITTL